jgi:RES domain-containing protein
MTAWRIGDPNGVYPIYSPEGAKRTQGRWNDLGDCVIYASEHYATSMLEKLVHWNGLLPPNQHFMEIAIPPGVTYEVVTADILPDWHAPGAETARRFGHEWYSAGRSAILLVPSVVGRPERNVVINATHPDFGRIEPGLETPVWWDRRLFHRNYPAA